MTLKELENQYKTKQLAWKTHIRMKPTKWQRFWSWVWYFIAFPWVWLFYNIRDWRTAICILASFLLWSASVWLFYLLGFIFYANETIRITMFSIGSAVWVWWVSPIGSPFILLVTFTAIGIKALFNKIREKKSHKKKKDKEIVGTVSLEEALDKFQEETGIDPYELAKNSGENEDNIEKNVEKIQK